MTSLVPQDEIEIELHDGSTLYEILTKAASQKATAEPETVAKRPKVIPVSDKAQAALKHVTDDLKGTKLPSTRRALTHEEAVELIKLGVDVKAAKKTLEGAVAALKTAVFNHLDVHLEDDNDLEDLPLDEKTGHYLVAGEIVVPEVGLRFTRELREKAPDVTENHLLDLYESGEITRAEYLKATRSIREIDEAGLLKLIQARPEVLEALVEILDPTEVTAAFLIREVKKD